MGSATRKVTIDFHPATFALVEDLADRYGVPNVEILREAISLFARLERDHRQGLVLLQRRPEDDKERELVILRFEQRARSPE